MILTTTSQNLSPSTLLNPPPLKPFPDNTMRTSLSLLRSLFHHHRRLPSTTHLQLPPIRALSSAGHSIERLESKSFNFRNVENLENEEKVSLVGSFEMDYKHLDVGEEVVVKELEELPEQWRRARLAWLCKQLPCHRGGSFVRILNGQKKWMRQDDATYVVVHCTRIRENDAAFQVYKWMQQQNWYRFDFALATKLADYLGKERKFAKCRKIFDDILNQGRVPSESTFHVLIVAYLSTSVEGCLEEACEIYNRMIQLGGYRPRLSLHNSLVRALADKPGGTAKHYYLKQAEFVYHNLVTSGFEIQKDIFSGLIKLHSYQKTVDKDRIISLREEMKQAGIQEDTVVLLSVLRACSKNGDVEEAERTWIKLLDMKDHPDSEALEYRMEAFATAGQPTKSLEIFGDMKHLGIHDSTAYHKIIEIMCKANEMNIAEQLMQDFIVSGMNPLTKSFIDLMIMYLKLSMHDKLESTFSLCLKKCRPNRSVHNIYLESLLQVGNIEKAEAIFNHMCSDDMIGVNSKSCNTILSGYLSSGEHVKAENIFDLMCQKKFDVEPSLTEKLEFALSLRRKDIKKPKSIKMNEEQREILMGLLLGGVKIESDEERKNHMVRFEFNENSGTHSILRRHLYDQYHAWLHPSCKPTVESEDVPDRFTTISPSYSFYANQFWPGGQPEIPNLIHRWLTPRVLAYWYMYGGYKTSSGDILLKVKGSREGVSRLAKALKAKSLECRVKKKGRVYWFGLLGTNASWFGKLIEPFVLEDLKDLVKAENENTRNYSAETHEDMNFDSDENESEQSETD